MKLFPVLAACSFLAACNQQEAQTAKYSRTYEIGEMPDKRLFLELSEEDKLNIRLTDLIVDSGENNLKNYVNNRARLKVDAYKDGIPVDMEENSDGEIAGPCNCEVDNDTLFISFYANPQFGFAARLTRDEFISESSITEANPPLFKLKPADSLVRSLTVPSKYQYMVINEKPSFKANQKLWGFIDLSSENFYEKATSKRFSRDSIQAKIRFTCITRNWR